MSELTDDSVVVKVYVGKGFNEAIKKATKELDVECEFSPRLEPNEMIIVTDDGEEHLCKLNWVN